MKSLLFTGMLTMGVAHTGAFLDVWEVPHVENHLTFRDVGRKLNKVVKWDEQRDTLRDARTKAREENYSLYGNKGPKPMEVRKTRRSPASFAPARPMRSSSSSSR